MSQLRAALMRVGIVAMFLFMLLSGLSDWSTVFRTKVEQSIDHRDVTWHEDYVVFYAAGSMVVSGDGANLYDLQSIKEAEARALGRPPDTPAGDGVLPYFNPPFFAGLLAPLALLPVGGFAALFFAAVCLSIICGTVALVRFLRLESKVEVLLVTTWFLSLGSITFLAAQSQVSMLPFLAWLLYLTFVLQGKKLRAGAILSLGLVKPQLMLAGVFLNLWRRETTALRAFAAIAGVLVVFSLVVSGPGVLIDYPRLLLESTSWERANGVILENMYGWAGFYARSLGETGTAHSVLTWSSIGVTLALTAWVCRRGWAPEHPNFLPATAVVLLATLLVSLHFYRQDMTLVALAIALCAYHSRRATGTWGAWPAVAVGVWFAQHYGPDLMFDHNLNVQTPAILAVFALAVWTARAPAAVPVWSRRHVRIPAETTRALGSSLEAAGQ